MTRKQNVEDSVDVSAGSPSCQLIVNADDLGWATGRDRGIFNCIDHGIVTSTSLMANGATFNAAVRELKQRNVGVGVHLNLADGKALSGPIAGLTDQSGWFLGKEKSRIILKSARFDPAQVKLELDNQMSKVLDTALVIDHIDSHQHMFLFPCMTGILIELCKTFNIAATRLPFAVDRLDDSVPFGLRSEMALYRSYGDIFKEKLSRTPLFMPQGLLGMALLNCLNEDNLMTTLSRLSSGCWELMVHPGEQDYGLEFCGVERQIENQALTSEIVQQVIIDRCVNLTTFGAAACIS